MFSKPSHRCRANERDQPGPETRTSACGTNRTQIEEGSEQRSVVSPEVSVELRNLREIRRRFVSVSHDAGSHWRLPHPSHPLLSPTPQDIFRFIEITA